MPSRKRQQQASPSRRRWKLRLFSGSLVLLVILTVMSWPTTTRAAKITLLAQVNDALRLAGWPRTFKNWRPFAVGVVTGNYKTFDQLAEAAKASFKVCILPDETKFKVAGLLVQANRCLRGEVVSLGARNVTVRYAYRGKIVTKVLRLNAAQYKAALERSIEVGSAVKACYNSPNLAGKLINLAPPGEEEVYAAVDGGPGLSEHGRGTGYGD